MDLSEPPGHEGPARLRKWHAPVAASESTGASGRAYNETVLTATPRTHGRLVPELPTSRE
jgi:hypothetical protein